MINEIKKNETKTYKVLIGLIVYVFVLMYVLNITIGRLNTLVCDLLTLILITLGVYYLYRYNIISYKYTLDDENLTIVKILGKNNEQVQAIIELKSILDFTKTEKQSKKDADVSFCATLCKSDRYTVTADIDGKKYSVIFQPSEKFREELIRRAGIDEKK